METLSLKQLKEKTLGYINGDINAMDISQWAANIHLRYEKRELDFVDCERKRMLEFIFDLIDLNDKRFADSKDVLEKKLKEL